MNRFAKQLIYGGSYLAIVLLIGWYVYRGLVPAPSCTDGIQNQGEEGVDCGAVCGTSCPVVVQPLQALPVQVVHNADNTWDMLVHFENPNGAYGASQVNYTTTVRDAQGSVLALRHDTTYVNPIQPHYIVTTLGQLDSMPASVSLQFAPSDVQWSGLTVDAAGSVAFGVRNELFVPGLSSVHYEATLTNQSVFDFDEVDVVVLLTDASGHVVGLGTTIAKTVRAQEVRAFQVDWPFAVPGAVRAQAFVSTNIFSNANFIRAYSSHEQFQGF